MDDKDHVDNIRSERGRYDPHDKTQRLPSTSISLDLCVTGTRCKLYKNDPVALYLHEERHLISNDNNDLSGDSYLQNIQDYGSDSDDAGHDRTKSKDDKFAVKMDPHDARLLLNPLDLSLFSSKSIDKKCHINLTDTTMGGIVQTERERCTDEEEEELNFERFGLLPEFRNCNKDDDDSSVHSKTKNDLNSEEDETSKTFEKENDQDKFLNSFSRNDDINFLQLADKNIFLVSEQFLKIAMKCFIALAS